MSHTVKVAMIADQEMKILGVTVNIHDIDSIVVDDKGKIVDAFINSDWGSNWLSSRNKKGQ